MQSEQTMNRYALWLEPANLHFHHGDNARVKVLWGYAMKREKLDKPLDWTGLVVAPDGREIPAPVALDRDGFNYELAFEGGPEGIYMAQVENRTGKTQYQARVLVPFGHHVHGEGRALNRGLEIVPGEYDEFHPGEAVELAVLLNGKPVPGVPVLATYHIYDGDGFPHRIETDEKGTVNFVFDARGHWMFQACAAADKEEHIATLVIPGVR